MFDSLLKIYDNLLKQGINTKNCLIVPTDCNRSCNDIPIQHVVNVLYGYVKLQMKRYHFLSNHWHHPYLVTFYCCNMSHTFNSIKWKLPIFPVNNLYMLGDYRMLFP